MIQNYYKNLFTKDNTCEPTGAIKGAFPRLSAAQWDDINHEIAKEEVTEAIMVIWPVKAPGPDGLHALFYQKNWNIIKEQVHCLVENFFQTGSLPMGLNDTNLVIIPKVQTPERVTQFRPIRLCNVAYKIVTKVMTNRLKRIMPDLISPSQSSFVPESQIIDNIVIYQEILQTIRRDKEKPGFMVIKIDLKKAYDRLDWEFIRDTLCDIGFNNN